MHAYVPCGCPLHTNNFNILFFCFKKKSRLHNHLAKPYKNDNIAQINQIKLNII